MTKLGGTLPKDHRNGLGVIEQSLLGEPYRMHVVMALVDCKSVTTNHDEGTVTPTARVRRIEVVLARDHELAELIMRRAIEARTGQLELDMDEIKDELRQAFDGVDLRTGEIVRRRTDAEPEQ